MHSYLLRATINALFRIELQTCDVSDVSDASVVPGCGSTCHGVISHGSRFFRSTVLICMRSYESNGQYTRIHHYQPSFYLEDHDRSSSMVALAHRVTFQS